MVRYIYLYPIKYMYVFYHHLLASPASTGSYRLRRSSLRELFNRPFNACDVLMKGQLTAGVDHAFSRSP